MARARSQSELDKLSAQIEALRTLDRQELDRRWRTLFGSERWECWRHRLSVGAASRHSHHQNV
jgi:hypothetical protein